MTSATDELRRLLDERGVKWISFRDRASVTAWMEPAGTVRADEYDGGLLLIERVMTPEQAIAATLGRGTCHVKAAEKIRDLFGFSLSCGHSMVNLFDDHPDYCPWCGRKVVD